jgi:PadR family transcriptional regulator PadR
MHQHGHRRGGPHRRRRSRRREDDGRWSVEAPVSRFIEPAALLALRNGSTHGYDLADSVGEFIGAERVDYGNLYRLLRSLEADGVVTSEWNDELPGRSKRMYELTSDGEGLLDAWIDALDSTQERIGAFLDTYRKGTP